jgi:hypothetical protein
VNEPDIHKVAQHLAVVLAKERHKAMEYTLLTALCTPAFVVVGALFAAFVAAYLVARSPGRFNLDAMTFYTAVSVFLAYMVAGTMRNSVSSAEGLRFDRMWITGAALFLVLLILTYATSLPRQHGLLFGVLYAIIGFLILGFVGQTQPPDPGAPDDDAKAMMTGLALAVPNLVTSAYRELLSASWLWFPPKPGEIRIAAMVLCRLATEQERPLNCDLVEGRVTMLLSRLKLIRVEDRHLQLTAKGLDLLHTAMKERYDRE